MQCGEDRVICCPQCTKVQGSWFCALKAWNLTWIFGFNFWTPGKGQRGSGIHSQKPRVSRLCSPQEAWDPGLCSAHLTCVRKMDRNHRACQVPPCKHQRTISWQEGKLICYSSTPQIPVWTKALIYEIKTLLWQKQTNKKNKKKQFLKSWVPNKEKHYHLSDVLCKYRPGGSQPSPLSEAVVWKSSAIQVVALFSNVCHTVWLISVAASLLHPPSFYLSPHWGRLGELVHFWCLSASTFCIRTAPG